MANNSRDIALVNNDLYIYNGDLVIGDSDEQHVSDTIAAFPGWWKENPADGVGALAFINSTGKEQELERSLKIQLQSDGYQVSNPKVYIDGSGILNVTPNAKKI